MCREQTECVHYPFTKRRIYKQTSMIYSIFGSAQIKSNKVDTCYLLLVTMCINNEDPYCIILFLTILRSSVMKELRSFGWEIKIRYQKSRIKVHFVT